jgi:ketosteroid isomerase-like protein
VKPARALVLTALVACQPRAGTELDAEERTAVVTSVDSATRAFESAQRARDPDRIVAHIAPGFYIHVDGRRVGYDTVIMDIRSSFTGLRHYEPGFRNIEVLVLARDAALSTFEFRDSLVDAAGALRRARGMTTLAWSRRDGQWHIIYAHAEHHPVAEVQDTTAHTGIPATLARMAAAVNAGDARAYAATYAADASIAIHGGERLTGRGAIERYEAELLRRFPNTRFALLDIWQGEAAAVARYAVNTPPPPVGSGHEGLLFYRFGATGEIVEERRYLDALTPMAQLGAIAGHAARSLPALPAMPRMHSVTPAAGGAAAVRALLEAVQRTDERAFVDRLAENVVIDEAMLPVPFSGVAGARAWFRTWTRSFPRARADVTTLVSAGDHVIVELLISGTLEASFGPLDPSSRPFVAHRAAVFRLHGGRVVEYSGFMNGRELADATAQWPLRARTDSLPR